MDMLQRGNARMASAGKTVLGAKQNSLRNSSRDGPSTYSAAMRSKAPHPIPAGMEGQPCPITGLFADSEATSFDAKVALAALKADPDIAEEARELASGKLDVFSYKLEKPLPMPRRCLPLNVINRAHQASSETRALIRAVGGLPTLRRFTTEFYKKCFVDPHVDKFIHSHEDPHGERFATWIAEKFGDGTPWTDERRTRPARQMRIGREIYEVAYDRSSAHFAAWHSPKREPHKWGDHFNLDDARIWMRLHFWAARETGMFKHEAFMDYYIRFIGHFISIYSSRSPPFTRESARWSADPQNVQRYLDSGRVMADVIEQPLNLALTQLPPDERLYTGSGHRGAAWPYELTPY